MRNFCKLETYLNIEYNTQNYGSVSPIESDYSDEDLTLTLRNLPKNLVRVQNFIPDEASGVELHQRSQSETISLLQSAS